MRASSAGWAPELFVFQPSSERSSANVTGGPSRPHAPSPRVRSSSLGSFGPASGNLQASPFVTKVTANKVVRSWAPCTQDDPRRNSPPLASKRFPSRVLPGFIFVYFVYFWLPRVFIAAQGPPIAVHGLREPPQFPNQGPSRTRVTCIGRRILNY